MYLCRVYMVPFIVTRCRFPSWSGATGCAACAEMSSMIARMREHLQKPHWHTDCLHVSRGWVSHGDGKCSNVDRAVLFVTTARDGRHVQRIPFLPFHFRACLQKCERLTLLIFSNILSAPFHEPVSPLVSDRLFLQLIACSSLQSHLFFIILTGTHQRYKAFLYFILIPGQAHRTVPIYSSTGRSFSSCKTVSRLLNLSCLLVPYIINVPYECFSAGTNYDWLI